MFGKIRYWIPLGFTITALSGVIYLTGQQNLRQAANDPQIQVSEDIASHLSANSTVPPSNSASVDIEKSLSPFIIIFDDKGKELYSTAQLEGKTPKLPPGVLDYSGEHNQNRLTWQPKSDVRIATIITKYSGSKASGYVLVGRSLREVEVRENMLALQIGLGWIVTMLGSLIAKMIFISQVKKKK